MRGIIRKDRAGRKNSGQYPGEFVPYILCWAGVALSWLVAHEARNNPAVATAITNNHRWRLIGVIYLLFRASVNLGRRRCFDFLVSRAFSIASSTEITPASGLEASLICAGESSNTVDPARTRVYFDNTIVPSKYSVRSTPENEPVLK